jgi:hypothetical protein
VAETVFSNRTQLCSQVRKSAKNLKRGITQGNVNLHAAAIINMSITLSEHDKFGICMVMLVSHGVRVFSEPMLTYPTLCYLPNFQCMCYFSATNSTLSAI